MINFYKLHSKKQAVNLFTKKLLLSALLVVIVFSGQAFGKDNNVFKNLNLNSSSLLTPNRAAIKKLSDAATLNVSLVKTDNPCAGRTAGTITTTVLNGVAPYTFLWNDGVTTQSRINLPRGIYTVDVTDALGDTGTATITLVDPQPIIINGAGIDDVKCAAQTNGNIFISVTGGSPPYTYEWTLAGNLVSNSRDLINQGAGVYTIRVRDSNPASCSANTQFTIFQPNAILVTESVHTNNVEFGDNNGAITLDVSGGKQGISPAPLYTYLWNDGVTTKDRTGLASGLYSVVVTDANNCTKPFSTQILPLTRFEVTGVPVNNKCFGTPNGSIDITAIGGISPYKFKWADQVNFVANPNRTALSAGTYTLTAQDNNGLGAIRTLPFTITEPTQLTLTATPTNNICFADNNGKIDLLANGGLEPYSYILDGGAPVAFPDKNLTISNVTSGTHSITIIDANSCQITPAQSVDILPTKALAFKNAPVVTKVRCSDNSSGSIRVTIEGGKSPYTYRWSNNPTNNTPQNLNLTEGDYTLNVSDALGCALPPRVISVTREAPPITAVENLLLHIDNICFYNPNSTALSKNGSATINLGGGSPNYTPTWTFEGKPITLVDMAPAANLIMVNNLQSGTYTLMVSDAVGCTSPIQTININPLKPINANPIIVNEKCLEAANGSIEVFPTGGAPDYEYKWTSTQFIGEQTTSKIENLKPGAYKLVITDSRDCKLDTNFVIESSAKVDSIEVLYEKANICVSDIANGSVKIKLIGGTLPYTAFIWSMLNGNGELVPMATTAPDPSTPDIAAKDLLPPGDYVLSVVDKNICAGNDIPFKIQPNTCEPANEKLVVDPLMSPNGDGQGNEFFYISKIEDYPNNEVIIYNRWGMEVFTIREYNNSDRVFRGVSNSMLTNRNEVLVDGVYYYTIRSVVDKKTRINKGYLIMKR